MPSRPVGLWARAATREGLIRVPVASLSGRSSLPRWSRSKRPYRDSHHPPSAERGLQHGPRDQVHTKHERLACGCLSRLPILDRSSIPEGTGPCQDLGDLKLGLSSTAGHTSK